ncbi:heavy metal translocating P-type ATPase [Helicobacter sp. 11S02629-2]|uniref:heavy metal translocating P-type ATPase n=1 Tax=Helicobacter sp. 11S02629-2 TaxID=1476195 RepID=UPI000BA705B3|nr:heavy metal translocating P-type ATPase [Helicobacter sp. 11S02629-2]PAF45297.1 copper-translocating P-type ATPase [Helicobacter sp. 11S02629-2]
MQEQENEKSNDEVLEYRINVEGMTCAACQASIEKSLKRKKYVKDAEVFLLTNSAALKLDVTENANALEDTLKTIEKLGYKASLKEDKKTESKQQATSKSPAKTQTQNLEDYENLPFWYKFNHLFNTKEKLILSVILTVIIVYISMLHEMFNFYLPAFLEQYTVNVVVQLIIVLIVMHLGRNFFIRGIQALIRLAPNMDSLVAIGALASFFYSIYLGFFTDGSHGLYFESVCVILTFVMFGKYIETNIKNSAMSGTDALLSNMSTTAIKLEGFNGTGSNYTEREIPSEDVKIGDYIKVMPFGYVPVDGILVSENASIDESMLSGESMPVVKQTKDLLYSGTLNLESAIIFKATQEAKDSTLNKIKELVEKARESKAQIARIADRVSLYFVPTVILLALIGGIAWWIADMSFAKGLDVFTTTLLISCPCALGLATPMALLFANFKSSANGIFFTKASVIETLSRVDTAVFDKTGTLSTGNILVKKVNILDTKLSEFDIMQIIASIEAQSSHIIAKALVKHAQNANIPLLEVTSSKSILGKGMEALINGVDYKLGNAGMFEHIPEALTNEASMMVFLSRVENPNTPDSKEELLSAVILEDELKATSKEAIARLKKMKVSVHMLSGDNIKNVAISAENLGITDYKGDCTPETKIQNIEMLKKQNHIVMMVGDGMNDAAALARSDVSMVMAEGSEVSLKQADVIVFNNEPKAVSSAIALSRATLRNIKQNLGFAFVYNIICIPISLGALAALDIWLNPMIASIAMSLSSVSVVLSSSRLYYFKG